MLPYIRTTAFPLHYYTTILLYFYTTRLLYDYTLLCTAGLLYNCTIIKQREIFAQEEQEDGYNRRFLPPATANRQIQREISTRGEQEDG